MKPELIEFINNARQRRGGLFRNQLYILIICFLLSLFFWALVRLSKDYQYTIEYRLKYIDIPSHLSLRGVSDTVLILKVNLQGYDFFREQFIAPHERVYPVSLRKVKVRYRNDRITSYMLTQGIGRDIASLTNFPSELVSVSPDTLFFEFQKRFR